MKDSIRIREVGLRDGLQMVSSFLPTERKVEWLRKVVQAGVREVEVTSFVPPKVVPQFADAAAVCHAALQIPGLNAVALVPNLKGAQLAIQAGMRNIHYTLSASNEHNLRNVNRPTEQSIADFARIVEWRDAAAPGVHLGVGLSTAFGCSIAGAVAESRVLGIVESLAAAGAQEITIADTVGYADPAYVKRLMRKVLDCVGAIPVAGHFHDTRGLGLANVAAALDVGVKAFDASMAGLGGCPFAPNASGNISTEDCAYMLAAMGFDTGVDLAALLALRRDIEAWMPQERFYGAIARAGIPKSFRQAA